MSESGLLDEGHSYKQDSDLHTKAFQGHNRGSIVALPKRVGRVLIQKENFSETFFLLYAWSGLRPGAEVSGLKVIVMVSRLSNIITHLNFYSFSQAFVTKFS